MRILITGTTGESMPPPYGGVPKLILTTARKWRENGHDVAITFTFQPKNPDDIGAGATYFFEYKRRPGKLSKVLFLVFHFLKDPHLYFSLFLTHFKASPRFSKEVILYSAYGVFLDQIIESWHPDVILSEAALIKSFMATEVAHRRGIPVAVDVYAEVRDLSMGENRFLNESQRNHYWISYLNKASLLIGLDNCAVELKAYVPREKLKIFWDTCDYQFFNRVIPESRELLRDYFNLPQDMFLVGAVGAFELRKGHNHLIQAVGKNVREGHNVGVVVCGGGDSKKWHELAKKHNIEGRLFTFQGLSQEDLARLHRCMDLYTNLSNTQRSCSLDLSLLEAMSSGLPVLVYDTGALPKAVPEGKNGFVVPMNEIDSVAEVIVMASKLSREELVEMGKISASIAAKADFSITTAIKISWLEELVSKASQEFKK